MKEVIYTIQDAQGVHARPAGLLVKKLKEFTATHRRNERCSTLFGRNVPKLFKKLSVVFIVIAVLSGIPCRIYARDVYKRQVVYIFHFNCLILNLLSRTIIIHPQIFLLKKYEFNFEF